MELVISFRLDYIPSEKEKRQAYELTCVCVCVCVCVSPFNSWSNWPIYTKFGLNFMPLDDIPTAQFLIPYNMADARACEVEATCVPLNVQYSNCLW
jgi:hypothetical protein